MEDGLLIYLLDSALKSICEKVSYGSQSFIDYVRLIQIELHELRDVLEFLFYGQFSITNHVFCLFNRLDIGINNCFSQNHSYLLQLLVRGILLCRCLNSRVLLLKTTISSTSQRSFCPFSSGGLLNTNLSFNINQLRDLRLVLDAAYIFVAW